MLGYTSKIDSTRSDEQGESFRRYEETKTRPASFSSLVLDDNSRFKRSNSPLSKSVMASRMDSVSKKAADINLNQRRTLLDVSPDERSYIQITETLHYYSL